MWMTVEEVSQYLRLSKAKVYQLVREQKLPFHNNHGFMRFYKEEIDTWMKTPDEKLADKALKSISTKLAISYRGRPIPEYMLTASKILIGPAAWNRLPAFIEEFIVRSRQAGGGLRREDILEIDKNANDYLRVSYQLGLIDKRNIDGRLKLYTPSPVLISFSLHADGSSIQDVIRDSILLIARDKTESVPDERHCLYLLWLYLTLLHEDCSIDDSFFMIRGSDEHNYYPRIRYSFIKSFYEFLFNGDRQKAMDFYNKWIKLIAE